MFRSIGTYIGSWYNSDSTIKFCINSQRNLFPIVFLILLPGYLLKVFKRGNYKSSFGERLGFFSLDKENKLSKLEKPIWIHAVSVGEVNIAKKFINSLKILHPDRSIVLSTTTPTGYSIASSSNADLIFYQPQLE